MTDNKESLLRLGAGTVPDPFGLAEEPPRRSPDEEAPGPEGPGATTSQDGELDEGGEDESEVGTARLGELD